MELKHINQKMPSILLVEDDLIAQIVHCLILEKLGCKVDCAASGEQTIALCLSNYQLILLDCGLPDKDGLEVAKTIRALEKAHCLTPRPIIMLSAFPCNEAFQQSCQLAGIDAAASKPISFENLKNLIEKYCGSFNSLP